MATLLGLSPDPLPPASGLSAPPPVPISSRAPIKDPTSTTTPRSGAVAVTIPFANTAFQNQPAQRGPSGEVLMQKKPARSATTRMPPTSTRPLVPHSERRSVQPRPFTTRGYRDALTTSADTDQSNNISRYDITPDGGSAGREGRQFAVANVGNNGRIYLRYVSPQFIKSAALECCVSAFPDLPTSTLPSNSCFVEFDVSVGAFSWSALVRARKDIPRRCPKL